MARPSSREGRAMCLPLKKSDELSKPLEGKGHEEQVSEAVEAHDEAV